LAARSPRSSDWRRCWRPQEGTELTAGTDLEDWLQNSFFEEHCKLFRDRPFV
jgi:hypothetical protein